MMSFCRSLWILDWLDWTLDVGGLCEKGGTGDGRWAITQHMAGGMAHVAIVTYGSTRR